MYKIHVLNEKSMSELIDLSKLLEEKSSRLLMGNVPYDKTGKKQQEKTISIMGVPMEPEYFKKLSEYCSPNLLVNDSRSSTSDSSITKKNFQQKNKPITKDAIKLKTISNLQDNLNKNVFEGRPMKYLKHIYPEPNFKTPRFQPDLVPGNELLIKIRVYTANASKSSLKFCNEIVVLSSHTLDILSDAIICANNFRVLDDMSENPEAEDLKYAKDVYKSGFFYIEDTFYNDMRHKDNIDCSSCIINWAKNRPVIGKFKTAIMENTTFQSLKIHLGYPQVYQHLGFCEHILVFSDVEVLQPSDICYSFHYPYYSSVAHIKCQYCNLCGEHIAKWIVEGSQRIPFDPALFCETCFKSFNYVKGKKVGNFKAYPYFERGTLV